MTTQYGTFLPGTDYEAMYNSASGFDIKISGIVRAKQGTSMSMLAAGIAYSDALTKRIIEAGQESDIVKAQLASNVNIMTMQEFNEGEKEQFIAYLGGSAIPYMVKRNKHDCDPVHNTACHIRHCPGKVGISYHIILGFSFVVSVKISNHLIFCLKGTREKQHHIRYLAVHIPDQQCD